MVIKETKVQVTGGSLRTSIPAYIVESLGIKKGDTIRWCYDNDTKQITIESFTPWGKNFFVTFSFCDFSIIFI